MTTSILLHSSPSPSPSPTSTPLPSLQPDLSSSSSSNSGSCLDLHRTPSAPSTRRIRFAPLPDPNRDALDSCDPSLGEPKSTTRSFPAPADRHDDEIALSPSISPDSTLSSARSTPTIRMSSKNTHKPDSKLLRPFAFLRRPQSSLSNSSPLVQSTSLPGSRNTSPSSLTPSSSSLPNSPSWSSKFSRFSSEDILSLGTKSLFRTRSQSATSSLSARPSSPPPKHSAPTKSIHRFASVAPGPTTKLRGKNGDDSSQLHDSIAGSATKKRRSSSSVSTPGAGGGRHASSAKMVSDVPPRPSTAPSSPLMSPKKHVKMLNGRVYGSRRYAAQTLANPFANVRDDPEFVEWGYGGMGSVHASAGIGNDIWKGLQRSERGGALLAGSSFVSQSASPVTAGGGRGGGGHATSFTPRRKMSDNVPECGMGNVSAGGGLDEDDGSGMAWLKKRRAEKEAKARLEQEAKQLEKKSQERRKSGDSFNASTYASTASTATSLTACTSTASMDLTTPLTSRSPSVTDLLTSSSPSEDCDLHPVPPSKHGEHSSSSSTSAHLSNSKDKLEHHVLTAVRLSPTPLPLKLKPTDKGDTEHAVDTETASTSSISGDGDQSQSCNEDDADEEAQDMKRKTAVGAGVEKISRHVDVEAR